MRGTIYALAEPDSFDIRYCGKTVELIRDRMYKHEEDAIRYYGRRHLYNWLHKIYQARRKPEVIVLAEIQLEGYTRSEQLRHLNVLERNWIEQLKVLGFRLTNATNGGDGCHGRKVSQETRDKTARSNRGKKKSPQTIENIKRGLANRSLDTYVRGPAHPFYGKRQTWKNPEARAEKIRAFWQALTEEQKRAHGRRHLGNKHAARITEEDAEQIRRASGYQKDIAKKFGVSPSLVSMIKSGKRRPIGQEN